MRLPQIALALLAFAAPTQAQEATPSVDPDAALRRAHDAWQVKWRAFTEASAKARQEGRLAKGGLPPEDVQKVQTEADQARDALLREFGTRDDLSAASLALLARVHENNRDYRSAVASYERSLAKGDAQRPDTGTLHSLCIAAMNSKDDALAAKWMRRLIEIEDGAEDRGRRQLSVRTSYYPRTLIALGQWDTLEKHLAGLATDESPACRAAATTFGVVAKLHRGDVDGAEQAVAAIRADPAAYPDHQSWAVAAQLALQVYRGKADAGARAVREFLATPAPERGSAVDRNMRRYLTAVEPFLGKPAPTLRADHWVGGEIGGKDPLAALRGKVVVLDFWQPWCEPCRNAMPKMVLAQERYAGKVQVLGPCRIENYGYDVSERKAVRPLTPEQYPAHVADFRKDMGLNYPLVICASAANNEAYKIAGVPTLVIVDREGIVRYMSCGAGEPGLFELALAGVVQAPAQER
ncbi:MAG: TlpA family protein disulfide reductase [Planctomycetes bacterium]|nr:TlpA family protein disulfide reductase [Planctomycetota bacterium]